MRYGAALLMLILVLGLSSSTQAAIILNDDFESYADQAAFEAAWPGIGSGSPSSATLATGGGGAGGSSQWVSIPITTVSNTHRNQRIFGDIGLPTALNPVTWSFDYFDSDAAGAPYRQFANLQDTTAPSGAAQIIAMGLNNNQTSAANGGNYYMARILGHTPTDTGGLRHVLQAQRQRRLTSQYRLAQPESCHFRPDLRVFRPRHPFQDDCQHPHVARL